MHPRQLRLLALAMLALGACDPRPTHDSSDAGEPPQAEPDAGTDADDEDAGADGGSLETPEGYRAGSRLEPRFHTAPGGARLFTGWWDHGLDDFCSFLTVIGADGNEHRVCANSWSPMYAYRDADCTEPVALTGANEHFEGSLVVITLGYICGENYERLYELGESIELTKTYRNNNGTGDCQENEESGLVAHVVKPVDLSVFVSGERVAMPDQPGSPLTVAYSQNSDGSREPLQPLLNGEACGPEAGAGGDDYRCMPRYRPVDDGRLFGDELCSEPAALGYSAGCNFGSSLVAERVRRDAAGKLIRSFHVAGAQLPKAFEGQPDACVEEDVSFDLAFSVGEELPWASFPALSVELSGEGRLRAVWSTTPGGHRLPAAGYLDTELGVFCGEQPSEGRCIPSDQARGYYTYADANCSVPVGEARPGSDARYLVFTDSVNGPLRLFDAELYTGPLYNDTSNAGCLESTGPRGVDVDWYVAGNELSLEVLASFE